MFLYHIAVKNMKDQNIANGREERIIREKNYICRELRKNAQVFGTLYFWTKLIFKRSFDTYLSL